MPTIRNQKSVLAILTELIRDGYSYSTLVKARSAISNVVSLCMNWNISNDPLISRFMRGTFSVQRPLLKHSAFRTSPTYFNTLIKLIQKHVPLKTLCMKSLHFYRVSQKTFSVQRPLPQALRFMDVSHVLQYLHKIDSETCSLKDITHEVVTLLQGVPKKKVPIKNFYSELLKASIHSF